MVLASRLNKGKGMSDMDEHNEKFISELQKGNALDYFVENKELFSRSELEEIIETFLLLPKKEIVNELTVRWNGHY